MIKGKVLKFGNNIDTDQIVGAHHLSLPTIQAMGPFTFEHHTHFITHFTRYIAKRMPPTLMAVTIQIKFCAMALLPQKFW